MDGWMDGWFDLVARDQKLNARGPLSMKNLVCPFITSNNLIQKSLVKSS